MWKTTDQWFRFLNKDELDLDTSRNNKLRNCSTEKSPGKQNFDGNGVFLLH